MPCIAQCGRSETLFALPAACRLLASVKAAVKRIPDMQSLFSCESDHIKAASDCRIPAVRGQIYSGSLADIALLIKADGLQRMLGIIPGSVFDFGKDKDPVRVTGYDINIDVAQAEIPVQNPASLLLQQAAGPLLIDLSLLIRTDSHCSLLVRLPACSLTPACSVRQKSG